MKNLLPILLLSLFATIPLTAQDLADIEHKDKLDEQTWVLMLKDGEQIVIRGDYEVRGDRTYFYYEHGAHPVYAMIETSLIDLEATREANEELRKERIRRDNYYRLIEEKRRAVLEEDNDLPLIVETSAGDRTAVDEEYRDDLREQSFYRQEAQQFPPYNEDELNLRPETWWRQESMRLFRALDESNARLSQLQRDHNQIALQMRDAESQEESNDLRGQLLQFRDAIETERNLARLIGNRLVELSEFAAQLEIPMEWIIPDQSPSFIEEQ